MRRPRRLKLAAAMAVFFSVVTGTTQAAERLTPAPPGAFSVVVIPDTQRYLGGGNGSQTEVAEPITNPIFEAHTRWIADNLERQQIVFVSHVGDIVDENDPSQWQVARDCMDVIHGQVPYGISVGNHDMTSAGDSSLFQEFFPASRFEEFDWYGGSYAGSPLGPQVSGNNANSYQLFSAGGMDFLFLHLECNAPDDVLEWANGVLTEYSDRRAMITTHMGWGPREKPTSGEEFVTGPKGRMRWAKIHGERANTPQQMWEKCYRKHENLFAVFSGDQSRTQAIRASTPGDHGNLIHEVLQDYSTGWLRLYRFVPDDDLIEAITFDPVTEELCEGTERVPDRLRHQFRLEYDMQAGEP